MLLLLLWLLLLLSLRWARSSPPRLRLPCGLSSTGALARACSHGCLLCHNWCARCIPPLAAPPSLASGNSSLLQKALAVPPCHCPAPGALPPPMPPRPSRPPPLPHQVLFFTPPMRDAMLTHVPELSQEFSLSGELGFLFRMMATPGASICQAGGAGRGRGGGAGRGGAGALGRGGGGWAMRGPKGQRVWLGASRGLRAS